MSCSAEDCRKRTICYLNIIVLYSLITDSIGFNILIIIGGVLGGGGRTCARGVGVLLGVGEWRKGWKMWWSSLRGGFLRVLRRSFGCECFEDGYVGWL